VGGGWAGWTGDWTGPKPARPPEATAAAHKQHARRPFRRIETNMGTFTPKLRGLVSWDGKKLVANGPDVIARLRRKAL
jgi:hypothetical protein